MKPIQKWIFHLAILTTSQSFAAPLAQIADCDSEGICQIQRSLKKDNGNSAPVPYRFKYKPAKNGAPTVIYIPGGPGGSSVNAQTKDLLQLPEDYGVIQTDPMFVGVNVRSDMNSFRNATTSEQIAKDIAMAADSVHATDLVIYGVSYGTVPGTILAANLSKEGRSPRAVILDGTLGRSITNQEGVSAFEMEWAKLVEKVGPEAEAAFLKVTDQLTQTGRIKPEKLGTIMQLLMMQRNSNDGTPLLAPLVKLSLKDPQKVASILLQIKEKVAKPDPEDRKWLHGVIGCKELFPESSTDADNFIFDGKMKAAPVTDDCSNYKSSAPVSTYDSKSFQISAPVFYLNGENDPATPLWQAYYHAQNQRNTNRRMIIVPDGGHGMLNKELKSCSSQFFGALQVNPSTASYALTPCVNQKGVLTENRPSQGTR